LQEFDLDLTSGRIHARRWGREEDPAVVCVHGLTANMTAFSWLAEGLVRHDHQVVMFDCRGRGRSELTPPGTYGLSSHARDVVELTSRLGLDAIAYVGWSMGAVVGLLLATQTPDLLRSLVMIDHTGPMDPEAIALVRGSMQRLDRTVQEPADFLAFVRSQGTIDPWTPFWTEHYTYELDHHEAGWTPKTDRHACEEDLQDALDCDYAPLWRALRTPTTLVRASALISGTRLVSDAARDAFLSTSAQSDVTETATNHYTVLTDPLTLNAVSGRIAG
jgi:pimeloyl-ACP methyl ester carboxylesterase